MAALLLNSVHSIEIQDFRFKLPSPQRHVKPDGITELELFLNLKIIAHYEDWGKFNDPLRELNFQVVIRGIGQKNALTGFHIDRHESQNTESGEIHPIYHFQSSVNPRNEEPYDFGSVLSLDAPRIMHFPMDFILGIGFLTANFSPGYYEKLLDDDPFPRLYSDYQEKFWKPYAYLMASYWKRPFNQEPNWNPKQICPYFAGLKR